MPWSGWHDKACAAGIGWHLHKLCIGWLTLQRSRTRGKHRFSVGHRGRAPVAANVRGGDHALDSGNHNTFTIMKIDIYNHVMPVPYLDMMKQHLKDQGILKRMSNLRMLWDIEARVRMLDEKF